MLDDPSVDIVLCATPNDAHKDIVIAAARAGKHIICEKPVALSVADFDEMTAVARECESAIKLDEARRVLLVMEACFKSGESGETLKVRI